MFRVKLNSLPAYNIHMELPVTPKPMPASLPDLPTDHTSKLFGIVYITLTGLAPLLWWALPTKTLAQVTPKNNRPAAQDWIPNNYEQLLGRSGRGTPAPSC
ncbi:hypothetical protein DSO57_1013044 [Entomophthora muscae]|uniref:Uncharacterized protein n=1 Tax=Entomophthora muscae TaxID=34485 RepID=A0ACC2RWX9_9FUNG|nr:hypothetical protein DSO57_1013044 [Entomophthora muscae]